MPLCFSCLFTDPTHPYKQQVIANVVDFMLYLWIVSGVMTSVAFFLFKSWLKWKWDPLCLSVFCALNSGRLTAFNLKCFIGRRFTCDAFFLTMCFRYWNIHAATTDLLCTIRGQHCHNRFTTTHISIIYININIMYNSIILRNIFFHLKIKSLLD